MAEQRQTEAEVVERLSAVFLKLPGARMRRAQVRAHAAAIAALHERNQRDGGPAGSKGGVAATDTQAADQIKKFRHSLRWLSEDLANLGAGAHDAIAAERGKLDGHQLHLSCLPMVLTAVAGDLDPALERAEARLRATDGVRGDAASGRNRQIHHALEIGWRARYAYFDVTGVLASRTPHRKGSFLQYLADIFNVLGIGVDPGLITQKLFSGKIKPPSAEGADAAEPRRMAPRNYRRQATK